MVTVRLRWIETQGEAFLLVFHDVMVFAFKFGGNRRFFGVDTTNFVLCRDGTRAIPVPVVSHIPVIYVTCGPKGHGSGDYIHSFDPHSHPPPASPTATHKLPSTEVTVNCPAHTKCMLVSYLSPLLCAVLRGGVKSGYTSHTKPAPFVSRITPVPEYTRVYTLLSST